MSLDSSPFKSLEMFLRWVIISITAVTTENILKSTEGVSKKRKRKTGKARPALMEPSDTYPVARNIRRKTPIHDRVSRG